MSEIPLRIQLKQKSVTKLIEFLPSKTIGALKDYVSQELGLIRNSLKLMGLTKGKLPPDTEVLSQCKLKMSNNIIKLMVIGTATTTINNLQDAESAFEVKRLLEQERAAEQKRQEEAEAQRRAAEAAERAEIQRQEMLKFQAQRTAEREAWEAQQQQRQSQRRSEIESRHNTPHQVQLKLLAFTDPNVTELKVSLPNTALTTLIDAQVQFPLTFALHVSTADEAQTRQVIEAAVQEKPENSGNSEAEIDEAKEKEENHEKELEAMDSGSDEGSEKPQQNDKDEDVDMASGAGTDEKDEKDEKSVQLQFAGVRNFEASTGVCSVPASIMRALDLQDGQQLTLTSISLQKGKFLQLQPLSRAWRLLPEEERNALLEFQLRKHHFMTEGQELCFSHNLTDYKFRVVETRPSRVVGITDTDLETDILPVPAELSRQHSVTGDIVELELGDEKRLILSPEEYQFFSFTLSDPNISVLITAKPDQTSSSSSSSSSSARMDRGGRGRGRGRGGGHMTPPPARGDPDLYISTSQRKPTHLDYTWCSQQVGATSILLTQDHPAFIAGEYHLGIRSYGPVGVTCTLALNAEETKSRSGSSGVMLSATGGAAGQSGPSEGEEICGHCRRSIPQRSMTMHSLRCERNNFYCEICQKVFPKQDQIKHMDLVHSEYICECGEAFQQQSLQDHRRDSCPLRLVPCSYCPLHINQIARGPHQAECGNREALCLECNQTFKRKEMQRHLIRSHDREKHSISFKDWL